MFFLPSPWPIARSRGAARRGLLLLVLGALLYGFGVQAARACLPALLVSHQQAVGDDSAQPCHGETRVTLAVCESHCRTDAQSSRTPLNFDLPAAAPLDTAAATAPFVAVALLDSVAAPPPRDSGPPLHVLFHRFLR